MQRSRRTVLSLALLAGAGRVMGAPLRVSTSVRASPLDAELAAIVAAPACELASLSVLAIRHGQVVYQKQFGQRFLGKDALPPLPANQDTMYRIASISKMMTTLGAMMLVEAGKLSLDADASDYLGFALRNPAFPERPISLRHLLSHTSSLRDDGGYSFPASTSLKSVLVQGDSKCWSDRAPPGAYFTYCNLGWGVLGTIMEKVSGERFDRLMKRVLLDPLGIHGGYNPSEFSQAELSNLATLYRKRTTDTEIWNTAGPWIAQVDDVNLRPPLPPAGIDRYIIGSNATPFSPTGGLRISAADMGKVMLMLMNDGRMSGPQGGRRLLQAATLKMMREPQWTDNGKTGKDSNGDNLGGLYYAWGLGTQLFPDIPGRQLVEGGGFAGIGHLGEAYGLTSVFAADLARRNGMIVLVGGVASDPAAYKAKHSSMTRYEEQILSALHRHAIRKG